MINYKEAIGKKRAYEHSTRLEIIKTIHSEPVDMSPEAGYYITYESGHKEGPMPELELNWILENNLLKTYRCGDIEVDAMDEDYAWEMLLDLKLAKADAYNIPRPESTKVILEELDNEMEELGWS